jgi:hypothetical protein
MKGRGEEKTGRWKRKSREEVGQGFSRLRCLKRRGDEGHKKGEKKGEGRKRGKKKNKKA